MQAIGKFFTSYWPLLSTAAVATGTGWIAGNGFKKTWNSITSIFTKSPKEDKA